MNTAVKLAMMIFSAVALLIALAQSEARAYLLSNGLPPHSLGYADNRGYLLYTDKLFDLHLTNPDSEGSEYIPMRIAFYTSPLYRKSILLNGYWSFPIFDSYIAKYDKNLICWQTLDLNIVKFRPTKDRDIWATYGGYRKLRFLKNGDYSIEYKDSDNSEQLIYAQNGLLKKIFFKIKGKAYAYNIYRTKDSLIIKDLRMKTIFEIEKRPSSQDGFKNEITLKSGENLFKWYTRDAKIYSGDSATEIETIFKFEKDGKEYLFGYESDQSCSKMAIECGESKKTFEWDSQNGFIRKDWLGTYSIKSENDWHIRVERTTPWAKLSFENFSDRGIYKSGYNDFALKRFIIGGNHSLSGLTRRIEIFKNGEKEPYKVLRYFYDKNGKETIKDEK
ncbi:MAG: hypothetical protein J6R08_02805 [Opitutales bacterium]|nr:hypothetical protein [Opitutales bacterium]